MPNVADYGSIAGLLGQMDDLKKRLGGGLTPPPSPFQQPAPELQNAPVNMAGAPAPQMPPQAPAPPLLAPPQTPNVPPIPVADTSAHTHGTGITGGLMHLLGADRLQPELGALLTPDQQERAKPGLASSLFGYLLAGQTPTQIEGSRAKKMLGLQSTKKEMELEKARAGIAQKYATLPMDPTERYNALSNMTGELAAIGHPDAVKYANILFAIKPSEASRRAGPYVVGGALVDDSGNVLYKTDKVPEPKYETFDGYRQMSMDGGKTWTKLGKAGTEGTGSEPVMAVEGPDGNPVYVTRSQAIGMRPYSAGVGSAINQASKARLTAAVGEMNNAHKGMYDYEQGLKNGTVKITAPAQVIASIANTFTHDDPISKATQNTALAVLNKSDPALARYIRRGMSFAEGESLISQRPSDFRTRMAAFLSTAASGASPEMVGDIEGRRTAILNPLNDVVMKEGKRSGASSGDKEARLNQRVQELKAQGKSKEEARAILKSEGLID